MPFLDRGTVVRAASSSDRGEGTLSYLAVVLLVATVVTALVMSSIPGGVTDRVQDAVCRVGGTECADPRSGTDGRPGDEPGAAPDAAPGAAPGNEADDRDDAETAYVPAGPAADGGTAADAGTDPGEPTDTYWSCGWGQEFCDFGQGIYRGTWDIVTGVWDGVTFIGCLVHICSHGAFKDSWSGIGSLFTTNPIDTLKSMWDDSTKDIRQDWNNDHHGTAAGRAVPTILGMIGGVGWFGRGTKLLKSLRRTDHADTDTDTDKGRVDPDNDGEGDTDGENTDTADVDQDTPGRVGPDGVRRFGPETDDHEFGKRMLGDRYDDVSQETRHAIEKYIPQPKENLGLTRPVLAREILQSWWNDTGPGWDLFSMNGDRPPSLEDVKHALGRSDLSDTQRALVNDILNAPDPAARLEHLLNDSGARGAITRKYGKWPALLDVERELGTRSVYVPHLANIPPAVTHGPEYSTTPLLKEFVGEDRGLSPRLHYSEIDYVRDPQRRDYFRIIVHNGELFRSNGQALNTDMPSRWAENGEWIFVMDRYGNLYANGKSKPGRFQHSSFLAGDGVAAAGEFVVHDGKLVSINDTSGHYEPPAEYLQQVVKMMRDAGADIDDDMINNWN